MKLFQKLAPQLSPQSRQDLICFCHLRWDFVYQRPQHLISRFAKTQRVFFFEEPFFEKNAFPTLKIRQVQPNLRIVTPVLPTGISEVQATKSLKSLINRMLIENHVKDYAAWFYSPMFLKIADQLHPR